MAVDEEQQQQATPLAAKESPGPKEEGAMVVVASSSQQNSSQPDDKRASSSPSTKAFILSVARKYSVEPLQNSDPGVWGVLTAISNNARKRPQGMNILLTENEHWIGRLVEDERFRIDSGAVSAKHCKIYRKKIAVEGVDQGSSFCISVFLRDTSTNGTFLNWEKLKKNTSEAKLKHGDIVSFAAYPQHEAAFAFVYREVLNSFPSVNGAVLKRKAEDFGLEKKRLKGIGIGAPEGPISLDDVRSLRRSNKELRKELESHAQTIETLRDENRAAVTCHEIELKELKESVSKSYADKIKELQLMLKVNQKELAEVSTVSAERHATMVDLNERLNASNQSRIDKDVIINSQKATISELESQLDEERNQRTEEREKALADHKAALQRAHSEALEELKRQADVASRQEKELKEVINKLQESDKESRLLVEALRAKLEDTRENLVTSEEKVRQLESQLQEEHQISANERKKVEALEIGMRRLRKELESEKVAREEAWAKVSALELEMAATIRDLSIEKQRFQGARERIILRETQLRAFYSTTEEISSLFAKQQEQLKSMQKTLEDEENYDNMSVDIDLDTTKDKTNEVMVREKSTIHRSNNVKESSAASTPRVDRMQEESSSDVASVTEKHDCRDHQTQDLECASTDRSIKGAFGSDIDGIGTAPVFEGDPIETERVIGTESPCNENNAGEPNFDSNKLAGDTMQLEDEILVHESGGIQQVDEINGHHSQSDNPVESPKAMEDTEGAGTIRTADLITSELAGSWAISTAPSVYGENESPRSGDKDGDGNGDEDEAAAALLCFSDGQAAGSQIVPNTPAASKMSGERHALNEMIKIVAPDLRDRFGNDSPGGGDDDQASVSDSDIEGGSDRHGGVDRVVVEDGSMSDATQEGSDQGGENQIDETEEDSLG